MQDAVARVDTLRKELMDAQRHVRDLKERLDQEVTVLQGLCEHDFVAELDDDYHNTRYEYTCTICGMYTRFRPANFRL